MKNWLFYGLLICPFISKAAWDLNDVSYLFPLPQEPSASAFLQLNSEANGGKLLDPHLIEEIPQLVMTLKDRQILDRLRVVGVRIDPCFPLPTPLECQRQVRLVWQIVDQNGMGQIQTLDAAIHSFYVLSLKEWQELLLDLSSWKTQFQAKTKNQALQIHPAWAQDGEKSSAFQEFQKLLCEHIGSENLFRVTAVILRGAGDMWAFETFELQDGHLEMQAIPRLQGRLAQTFVNFSVAGDQFENAQINPMPLGPDTFNSLAADSSVLKEGHENLIYSELQVISRIENPKIFNAENMDCVSCHVAQSAKHWVFNQRADLDMSGILNLTEYKNSKYNLANLSPERMNTQNLRAFGYFGSQWAVSQRVINESAEVADFLNGLFGDQNPE